MCLKRRQVLQTPKRSTYISKRACAADSNNIIRSLAQVCTKPHHHPSTPQKHSLRIPRLLRAHRIQLNRYQHALHRRFAILGSLYPQPPLPRPHDPLLHPSRPRPVRRVQPSPLASQPQPQRHAARNRRVLPPARAASRRGNRHGAATAAANTAKGVGRVLVLGNVRPPVERDARLRVEHDAHEVLAQRGVAWGGRLAAGAALGHEKPQGLGGGGKVELGGDDLEEAGDAGARLVEELGADGARARAELQASAFVADLEDELGGARVDVGARVRDPAGEGVRGGGLGADGDAALEEVAEAKSDLVAPAGLVVGDGVGDETLLEALEVEVAAVLEELGAVGLGADGDGVAAEELKDLGKGVGAAVGDRGGDDGGRAEEALAVETGEEVVGAGEEDGEAEGEEVGRVARAGEDVARDLELAVADGGEDGFLVELGYQLGEAVELGVGEEADKVGAIAGVDVVALEVQGDVPEGDGVTVDVESPDGRARVLAGFLGALELGCKVVREI